MATNKWPIPVASLGIAGSNQPTLATDADTNLAKWVMQYAHGSEQRAHFAFYIPPNYLSGSLTFRLRWRSSSTSGNVVWKIYALCSSTFPYSFLVNGASTATATTAVPGTTLQVQETAITISPTNLAADRALCFVIARDGANGSDTCTGVVELLDLCLEYAADATIAKGYIWLPPLAFALPSGSTAFLGYPGNGTGGFQGNAFDSGGILLPTMLQYPLTGNPSAHTQIILPNNFRNNLKTTLIVGSWADNAHAFKQHIDIGAASVGGSSDPSLSSQSSVSMTVSNTNQMLQDKQRVAIVTPAAGQSLSISLARDSTDTQTNYMLVYGVMLEYDLLARTGQVIRLDPGSAALPASPASLSQDGDANLTKVVAQFAQSVTQSIDLVAFLPSTYGSGGTVRVRWRTTASSGNARLRVDSASAATSSASDPSLTSGTAATCANAGAGLINENTFDVSGQMVAGTNINLRISRIGGDAADTIAATVEILEAILETNPT